MFVVEKKKGQISSLPAKELTGAQLKALGSPLARKIVRLLSRESMYPRQISKILKEGEQKIYYHMRNLEAAKIVSVQDEISVRGVTANVYSLTEKAFVVRFGELLKDRSIEGPERTDFLEPFIEAGKLNATIVVGSPDPHGPQKARSRDGYYGIDLALFLGTYLHYVPKLNVRLDTEVREEDLLGNLIILGGPIVNMVNARVNAKLPIRFDKDMNIYSHVSGKVYMNEEAGLIVKADNPLNPRKKVIVIAGKRHAGTRAVMLAFLEHFEELAEGNRINPLVMAKVVEGADMDSDGIVDSVEILE